MDLAQLEINQLAYQLALKSNCKRRRYGAVLVKDNMIIGTGYNHANFNKECSICTRENCTHNEGSYNNCPAIHAEIDAINHAHANNIYDLKGAHLYLVGIENNKKLDNSYPCHVCKKVLDEEGIIY